MRERLPLMGAGRGENGITPARAGKTAPPFPVPGVVRDHPRSCGKDGVLTLNQVGAMGSPPLVRERQKRSTLTSTPTRITPARAGKTIRIAIWDELQEDHPRSCGKDLSPLFTSPS